MRAQHFTLMAACQTSSPFARTVVYAVSARHGAVTWHIRPDLGAMLGSLIVTGTAPQTFDLDVTWYIRREKQAGHNIVSLQTCR
jgi:hypothetical protein